MDAWVNIPPRGSSLPPRSGPDYEEPPPPKVNYRSMGRGTGGVALMRGGLSLADRAAMREEMYGPSASTIPENFTTVLYKGNGESKGFGSRTTRFELPKRQDSHGLAGTAAEKKGEASVGVRGHNSFASKAPRLPRRAGNRAVPSHVGPGSYEMEQAAKEEAPLKESAAFVLPSSVNPLSHWQKPPLGPGEYHDSRKPDSTRVTGVVPKTGRDVPPVGASVNITRTAELPGPGHYASSPPATAGIREISLGPGPRPPAQPPPVQTLKETSQRRLAREVLAVQPGAPIAPLISDRPPASARGQVAAAGPGQYDVDSAYKFAKDQKLFGTTGSGVFQAGTSHLPRSWRPIPPGPGDYEPQDDALRAEPSSLAGTSFRDRQDHRWKPPKPQAPGPAWYTPRLEQPKSFNTKDTWV